MNLVLEIAEWLEEGKNIISRVREKRISFNLISAVNGIYIYIKKAKMNNKKNMKPSVHQVLCAILM